MFANQRAIDSNWSSLIAKQETQTSEVAALCWILAVLVLWILWGPLSHRELILFLLNSYMSDSSLSLWQIILFSVRRNCIFSFTPQKPDPVVASFNRLGRLRHVSREMQARLLMALSVSNLWHTARLTPSTLFLEREATVRITSTGKHAPT